jgi:hypothetical protein
MFFQDNGFVNQLLSFIMQLVATKNALPQDMD